MNRNSSSSNQQFVESEILYCHSEEKSLKLAPEIQAFYANMPEPYTSGSGDLGSKALDSLLLYNHLRPAEDSPSEVHSNHASVAPVVAPSAHKMPSVPSPPPRFNNFNKVNSAATNNPGLFLRDTFGVITHVHLDGRHTSTSKPTSANRTMAYLPPNGQYNMPIKRPSSTERRPLNQTPRNITILR